MGRSPSHRRAMLRNLAASLILTERDPDHPMFDDKLDPKAPRPPKVRGRVVTTVEKAKEVRSLVERCITIARKSLVHEDSADTYDTDQERNSDAWKDWRSSDDWQNWNQAMAPALAARRRCLRLLGSREAVEILFDDIAPRFSDRNGGYTRVVRLAHPRLGDAGTRAILELVGVRDRVVERSEKPEFASDDQSVAAADQSLEDKQVVAEEEAAAAAGESDLENAQAAGSADTADSDEAASAGQPSAEQPEAQDHEEKDK